MKRLWLVRHGPTHAKTMVGWTDLPADLSDKSKIAHLRDILPDQAVLVSSDLMRARATADAISSGQNRLADDSDLREIHFGDWENLSYDQVPAHQSDLVQQFWNDPGQLKAPNGESWNDMVSRSCLAIDRLLEDPSFDDLVIVCHMGVIMGQILRAGGMSAKSATAFKIDNFSLTRIDQLDKRTWRISGVNL